MLAHFLCSNIGSCGHELLSELKPVTLSPVYKRTIEEANELISHLGFAFNNITAMSQYEDCYDTASAMLDYIKEYETPPIELIDGEAYKYTVDNATIETGVYYDGRLHNHHGTVDANNCTNIKLLEVKS